MGEKGREDSPLIDASGFLFWHNGRNMSAGDVRNETCQLRISAGLIHTKTNTTKGVVKHLERQEGLRISPRLSLIGK